MNIKRFLFYSLIVVWCACNGAVKNKPNSNEAQPINFLSNAKGRVVKELSPHIWYIFQDQKQNYWFASNGEGVYRYDGKIITQFTTTDGLANDTIRQIQEDKLGNIYFSTFGGVSKFDGNTFTTLQPIKSQEWKLEPNDLWFYILGKKNPGVYRYDGKNLYNLEFPKHYLHDEISARVANSFFSPYEVYSIYKDRKGAVWFGTSVFGACRFDGKTVKWMYEEELTTVPAGGTFGIRSIWEDKAGHFWICNTHQRFIFDWDKTAKSDRLQYQKIAGVGNEKVFFGDKFIYYSHILDDANGTIWLTTWSTGIFSYSEGNFTHYPIKDGEQNVNVVSMYKDNFGNLWLGTANNSVYKFNGKDFIKFQF